MTAGSHRYNLGEKEMLLFEDTTANRNALACTNDASRVCPEQLATEASAYWEWRTGYRYRTFRATSQATGVTATFRTRLQLALNIPASSTMISLSGVPRDHDALRLSATLTFTYDGGHFLT